MILWQLSRFTWPMISRKSSFSSSSSLPCPPSIFSPCPCPLPLCWPSIYLNDLMVWNYYCCYGSNYSYWLPFFYLCCVTLLLWMLLSLSTSLNLYVIDYILLPYLLALLCLPLLCLLLWLSCWDWDWLPSINFNLRLFTLLLSLPFYLLVSIFLFGGGLLCCFD